MTGCIKEYCLSDRLVEEETEDEVHTLEIGMKHLHIGHTTIPIVTIQLGTRT